ncbi:MAG: 23S rRNA (uracil(1939)-C(5))-methyltransferase RlmD [Lachnospiraceae bacterium]
MEYKKNDIVQVTIEDIGNDGEGIGKIDGYTLFIKDAVMGDLVEARIMKTKKQYGYAKVEKVLEPSPFRVQPKCDLYRQCGGCQLQALQYPQQLIYKQHKVKNHLVRIGKFEESLIDTVMEPIIGMEEPYHYRNKAQFPMGTDTTGNPITGFYANHTHRIVSNTDCVIGSPCNQIILQKILDYMRDCSVSAYEEESGQGLIRHVLIRVGHQTDEIMVCLIINGEKLPKEACLLTSLTQIEHMTSVSISINKERTNVIMGKSYRTLWGQDYITDSLGGIQFHISPLSFYQVNSIQAERLYEQALEYAGLTGNETVWDLYCGIGTISLFLSKKAKQVYGVEVIPQAIEDANQNAILNGITNVRFLVGKAEEVLPEQYEQNHIFADVIVVDPPRKGCEEACLMTMIQMQPERIVYVSCDSATLARDLKLLCEHGYELRRVRAVDQFCQTGHVECVTLLQRIDT